MDAETDLRMQLSPTLRDFNFVGPYQQPHPSVWEINI